jgi:hypothetical protein
LICFALILLIFFSFGAGSWFLLMGYADNFWSDGNFDDSFRLFGGFLWGFFFAVE